MIKIKLILLLALMFGCSTTNEIPYLSSYSPELQDDIFEYLADCQRFIYTHPCHGKLELIVKVQKLPDPQQLGVCYSYYPPFEHKRHVFISPKIVGTDLQKLVVYHELTHCIFNYDHYDKSIDIMNPYADSGKAQWLYDNWEYALEQMFSRIKP